MRQKSRSSDEKVVNIKVLPADFYLYSNPIIMMVNLKGGKRAEAGQWTLEIQKMLKGLNISVIGLENIINQDGKKHSIDNQEIIISNEERYWFAIYLVDNAILRIYACLDKIAQMCRCYLECEENGGSLRIVKKCKCEEVMNESNCNFGGLVTYLNSSNRGIRNSELIDALNALDKNKSIKSLREYRNTFTHRKHKINQSMGIDPAIRSNKSQDGKIETIFSFGELIPSLNWFRVEIVGANNAVVDFICKTQHTIFPRDFNISITKK